MTTEYNFVNFAMKKAGKGTKTIETINSIPVKLRKEIIEEIFHFIGSEGVQSASTAFKVGCLAGINWLAVTPLNELGYWGLSYFPVRKLIESEGIENIDPHFVCYPPIVKKLTKVIGESNKLMLLTNDNLDVECGMISIFEVAHNYFEEICEDCSVRIDYDEPSIRSL